MRWRDIHAEGIAQGIEQSIITKTRYKIPLLRRVQEHAGGQALEAGCGTATSLAYLTRHGISCVGVDSEPATVELAREVLSKDNAHVLCADIRALPFADGSFGACFSNGVLEHFIDDEIRTIVQEQLRVARTAIVGVPSRQYDDAQRIYGDERFMTVRQWLRILEPVCTVDEVFGYHHKPSIIQRVAAPFDPDMYQFLGFVLSRHPSGRR